MKYAKRKEISTKKYLKGYKRVTLRIAGSLMLILLINIIHPECIVAQKTSADNSVLSQDQKNYKVTFIELGSVRCVPCKQMQTVMKSIEKKYYSQVKIIFYDVWTPAGKQLAKQFTFNAIPTQIFLDKTGKEFYRHEGFFPEDELVKVLQQKGVFPSVQ